MFNTDNWTDEDLQFYYETQLKAKSKLKKTPPKIKQPKVRFVTPRRLNKLKLPDKYWKYKLRAEDKHLPFELTVEQFNEILSRPCHYCGGISDTIDRMSSGEGYTLPNSYPACIKCNMMKYTYSKEIFLEQVRRIYNHLKL